MKIKPHDSLWSEKERRISIVLEDLSRNSDIFSNRSEPNKASQASCLSIAIAYYDIVPPPHLFNHGQSAGGVTQSFVQLAYVGIHRTVEPCFLQEKLQGKSRTFLWDIIGLGLRAIIFFEIIKPI